MKKFTKSPLAAAMGTLVLTSFAADVSADVNPFAVTELSSGYMQMADLNNKVTEGGCGSNNGNSGQTKATQGSCGEGKCGAMMSGGKMKPGMEHSCGAMMKNHDGACGMAVSATPAGEHADHKPAQEKASQGSCGAAHDKSGDGSCGAMMKGH